jgi:hypothetical protein
MLAMLEQGIAEAQRHQVLHRRLAEVVVDPERLPLLEHGPDDAVDLLRAGEVVAERLFQHDADVRAVEARRAELLADRGKQVRARREVQHGGVGAARIDPVLQAAVVVGPGEIHAAVVQQLGEVREFLVARALGALDLDEALADEVAVIGVAALVARDGEDPPAGRQLAVAEGLEQRRHQLAPGEVAGAAEEDEVEGHVRCVGLEGAGRPRGDARSEASAARPRGLATM